MRSDTARASRSTYSSRTALVHQDPLARRAALARAQEARRERRLDRGRDVGVVHHDERPVAAHLEQRRLAGRRGGDQRARRGRADEGDAGEARVARDLVADDRARPGDEVEDARRKVGVDDRASQLAGADRRRGRRRPDDGVARGERGRDQLGGHRVGPVPRADHPDRPARAAHQHHAVTRGERVRKLAPEPLRVLGRHPPVLDELVDLAVGLGVQGLALVERQHPRELIAALLDEVADGVHLRGPLERREAGPALRGRPRRGDRADHVGAIPLRDLGDLLARRGARCGEGLAARAGRPLAAHEQLADRHYDTPVTLVDSIGSLIYNRAISWRSMAPAAAPWERTNRLDNRTQSVAPDVWGARTTTTPAPCTGGWARPRMRTR